VLDDSSAVFGGFAASDWSGEDAHGSASAGSFARGSVGYLPSPSRYRTSDTWFGAADAFVFSLAPDFAAHRWTRANTHWQLAKDDCIAFGGGATTAGARGGGGACALWLDAGLERGASAPTETFGNAPLTRGTDAAGFFRVVRVELWAFLDAGAAAAGAGGGALAAVSKATARAASSLKTVLRAGGKAGPD